MNARLAVPRTAADWRQLALRLADWQPGALPAAEPGEVERLKETAWDVASYAAFWRTVQLPSLGPGLLPGVVALLLMANMALSGQLSGAWLSPSNPLLLWPSLWLVGWFAVTVALAVLRHARAKRQVLRLGVRLGLL